MLVSGHKGIEPQKVLKRRELDLGHHIARLIEFCVGVERKPSQPNFGSSALPLAHIYAHVHFFGRTNPPSRRLTRRYANKLEGDVLVFRKKIDPRKSLSFCRQLGAIVLEFLNFKFPVAGILRLRSN